MLSAINRIKLALVLLPAILVPPFWFILALISFSSGANAYDTFILFLQGAGAAFVAAYSITSFIDFMRVLRNGQQDEAR